MKSIAEKIRFLRERKNLTQGAMGDVVGLKLTTYAAKEKSGKFNEIEFAKILKKLGISKDEFEAFKVPGGGALTLSLPEALLTLDAKLDITLSVLAELLAKQNGQSVTGTVNDLTKAVKELYEKKTTEVLKSGQ